MHNQKPLAFARLCENSAATGGVPLDTHFAPLGKSVPSDCPEQAARALPYRRVDGEFSQGLPLGMTIEQSVICNHLNSVRTRFVRQILLSQHIQFALTASQYRYLL